MSGIWKLDSDFSIYILLSGETSEGEPAISVTYRVRYIDLDNFQRGFYTKAVLNNSSTAAELVLLRDDFDADYFKWGGSIFVSQRMRQAMGLDPSEVRFFEVDDSKSAPLARSKIYQIMEPQVSEDVSDPEKSDYRMTRFLPDMPFSPSLYGRLVLRPDAAPKHDLFYDGFFREQLLCTQAFASRVLEAGCTGMQFEDPSKLRE
jgi:hypothetical protein